MKHKDNANSYITALILLSILLILGIHNAHAISAGITGYSGNPDHNSGANCTTCHSGGSVPVLVFSGPAAVMVGTTNSYSITLSGGQQSVAGFDLSASDGELIDTNASGTTKQASGEITHAQSINVGTTAKEWTFDWVAPGVPANVTFYVSALSGDGDTTSMGDNTVSETYAVTVTIDNSRVPTAKVGGPYIGAAGVAVQFNAGASFDLDGNIVRYLWDFGDNTAFVEGATPTHSYTDVGEYTVTLAVTDNDGLTGAAADTVTIGVGLPPVANAGGPYAGNVGTAIQFDASASNDPDGNIVTYNWDFGDGNSGTGVSSAHSYATEGSFNVVLTITDNDNWMDSTTTTANITTLGTSTGEELYNTNCSSCHGAGGLGGTASAVTDKTATQISNAIVNIASMNTINLSIAEIQLIADYLFTGAPPPTTGQGLYDANCASCHGAGGLGGTASAVTDKTATQISGAIVNIASMNTINLSIAEIQLIADFLFTGAPPPTTGQGLYDANCASCHGAGGLGGTASAVTDKTATQISGAIVNIASMNTINLSIAEIQLIADYLFTGAPPPTTGEGLYDANCASCHGAGGAGGIAIPVIGSTAALITNGINNVASMSTIPLSAAEIQLISDYLNSGAVAKPTDGPGLYAAYCESCHGVDGEGGPDGSVTGKSESDINSYIDSEPDMQSLGSLLTSQEIGLIADFLNGN